jgi:hypothetical protein
MAPMDRRAFVDAKPAKHSQCGVALPHLQSSNTTQLQPSKVQQPHRATMAQSDEEDEYMNMTFDEAPKGPQFETSLQRAARKRKEARLPRDRKSTPTANNRLIG